MSPYVVNSLLWALVGLILGFFMGVLASDIHDIRRHMVVHSEPDPAPRRRRPFHPWRLFGVILVVMSVLSVGASAIQTTRLNRIIECQAAYNDAFAESIRIRADATVQERNYQRDLWLAFLRNAPRTPGENNPAGRDASIRALNSYLKALDDANKARQVAPIPDRNCTDTGVFR